MFLFNRKYIKKILRDDSYAVGITSTGELSFLYCYTANEHINKNSDMFNKEKDRLVDYHKFTEGSVEVVARLVSNPSFILFK